VLSSVIINSESNKDSFMHLFDKKNQEVIIFQRNKQDYIRVNVMDTLNYFIDDLKTQLEVE
jgi:hypothetical protein